MPVTAIVADLAGVALVVGCVVAGVLVIRRADHNNVAAAQRNIGLAASVPAEPMPTDLELMYGWIQELARKVDADARSRQTTFQWFLFALPFIYAVTYGILYAVIRLTLG